MRTNRQPNHQQGIALITALLVLILISSIIVGFSWLVMSDQTLSGATNNRQEAFYAAEAGMEKMTADLNNLFGSNYAPTGPQISALEGIANEPDFSSLGTPGITFIDPAKGTAGSGYAIQFTPDSNGNPLASSTTITSGPYQGMQGLVTPYTLNVIAESPNGGEVKLQREVQTVGIPLFQFGMFSQTDLSFFAGPDFNFGGRVHTNGNLYLASGSTLELGDKVTALGNVIRTNLSNGYSTSSAYAGTVDVLTSPGVYRALQTTEGSLKNTIGSAENSKWPTISMSTYNGYIRTGDSDAPEYPTSTTADNSTGVKALDIEIATPAIGGNPIDLIRRPVAGEDTSNPGKLGERYYSQASLRILISDNPNDITELPCVSPGAPVDLSLLAQAGAQADTGAWATNSTLAAIENAARTEAGGAGSNLVPLATSGAANSTYTPSSGGGTAGDGYWLSGGTPIISGYIKIDAQTSYGVPCGTYQDVTAEILGLGYAGKNIDPYLGETAHSSGGRHPTTTYTYGSWGPWELPSILPNLPGSQMGVSTCADPNPNAVIRLERVRDNPSTGGATGTADTCGTNSTADIAALQPTDFWPNALFDAREGNPRDWCPDGSGGSCTVSPELGGVMYYVELDVANLAKWFSGTIGVSGALTKDPNISSNDFSVYFSDRRSNYTSSPVAGGWPPASPSGNETGEYGFNDVINPASQYGCPNNVLDTGEDFDSDGVLSTYGALAGQAPYAVSPGVYSTGGAPSALLTAMTSFGAFSSAGTSGALYKNWKCSNPSYTTSYLNVWPGWYVNNPQEARENPALFFRRALKLVDGSSFNVGTCPNGNGCGLAIASENPVYVQDDFNSTGTGCGGGSYGAASIIADAATFLSDSWNDVNSFISTYDTSMRAGSSTTYRVAVAAGKGVEFPQPTAYTTYQDFGTDGGVHNFLRFLEDMGSGTVTYKGSIVSLFYSRQANGVYKDGSNNTVYAPPNRGYKFDSDFLTPACLPPRTPMFRDTNTVGFTEYMLPN